MKRIYYTFLLIATIGFASCSSSQNTSRGYYNDDRYDNGYQGNSYQNNYSRDISYETFYNDLSPYGNWINYPGQGSVWIPYERNFQPYQTNGRWVFTNYGWTWASNYNWGWAPFHYGRWQHDFRYGWMWVPGYEWGPAWVAWRGGGGYYGWAPLAPGMNINISIGSIPHNNWYFVPSRYINSSRMDRYYVRPARNVTIINNTTIINNYIRQGNNRGYVAGPRVNEVERQTNTRIAPIRVINTSAPGRSEVVKNEIGIYRPGVKPANDKVNPADLRDAPIRRMEPQKVPSVTEQKQNVNGNAPQQNTIKPTPQVRKFPKMNPENNLQQENQKNETIIDQPINRQNVKRIRIDQELKPVDDRTYNRSKENNVRREQMTPQPERRVFRPTPERKEQPQQRPVERPVRQQPVRQVPQRKITPSPAPHQRMEPQSRKENEPVRTEKRVIRKF